MKTRVERHFLFGSDVRMVAPMVVCWSGIHRVRESTDHLVFHWRLIGIPAKIRRSVAAWCRARKITLIEYDLTGITLRSQVTNPRLSEATALRLVPVEELKAVGERVCYFDSDVLVLDSLAPLFSVSLGKFPCAALDDPSIELLPRKLKLGLTPDVVYFNAGVLVINTAEWIAADISRRAREFLYGNPTLCPYEDQDALNATIRGNYLPLPERFNRFSMLEKGTNDWKSGRWAVIHFAAIPKPWSNHLPFPHHVDHALFYWRAARGGLSPCGAILREAHLVASRWVETARSRIPKPPRPLVEKIRFIASHPYVVANALLLLWVAARSGKESADAWKIAGFDYYKDRLKRLSPYPLGSYADRILNALERQRLFLND
ncbi:MAG: glycosyltransferase [Terrimicrobiaceae bacterium]|nr:glycosyltransferase [Terrimicrobiaceae bacterium]